MSQCLRVFGSTRKFVIACYIVGAILIAFTVFITVFLCKPVFHFWHPERPGTCLPRLPVRSVVPTHTDNQPHHPPVLRHF